MNNKELSTETTNHISPSTNLDIHICGGCKLQFYCVKTFLEHKQQPCPPVPINEQQSAVGSDNPTESLNINTNSNGAGITSSPNSTAVNVGANVLGAEISTITVTTTTTVIASSVASAVTVTAAGSGTVTTTVSSVSNSNCSKKNNGVSSKTNSAKRFHCEFDSCQYHTSYLKDLLRHRRTHTGEKPFSCSTCGKNFNRADKLKVHERWHTGDKPYKCKECNYATGDNSSLKKHLRIHSDERPFKCQICPYASRNSSQLVVHLRTHTGDSPFHCPICNTKFKINSDLKRHLRMHTGEKPFACQLCNYRCAIKGNLKTHMRLNHSVENLQKCSRCDFVTPSRKALREHEKSHDAKALKCPQCHYSCTTRGALRNHLRVHSTERPFKCDYCSYASRQPGNVRTHVKKRHPEKLQRPKKSGKKAGGCSGAEEDGSSESVRKSRGRPLCVKSFRCSWCEAAFVREDSLRSHVRQHQERLKQLEGAAIAVLQLSSPTVNSTYNNASELQLLNETTPNITATSSTPSMETAAPSVPPTPETTTPQMIGVSIQTDLQNGTITSQSHVIEQALQQSGVIDAQPVLGTSVDVSAAQPTSQVIAYIQNPRNVCRDENLSNATILATLNLKNNTSPIIAPTPQILSLDAPQQPDSAMKTISIGVNQSVTPVCNLQQTPMMYQLQPAGLSLLPVLSVSNPSVQTSPSSCGSMTTVVQDQSNVQYIVHTPTEVHSSVLANRSVQNEPLVQSSVNQTNELLTSSDKMLNCIGVRIMGADEGSADGAANLIANFGSGLGTLLHPLLVSTPSHLNEPVFISSTAQLIADKATSTTSSTSDGCNNITNSGLKETGIVIENTIDQVVPQSLACQINNVGNTHIQPTTTT